MGVDSCRLKIIALAQNCRNFLHLLWKVWGSESYSRAKKRVSKVFWTGNVGGIRNCSDGCYLCDHCAGRNATSLVHWLPTCMDRLKKENQRTIKNWTKATRLTHRYTSAIICRHTHTMCGWVGHWAYTLVNVFIKHKSKHVICLLFGNMFRSKRVHIQRKCLASKDYSEGLTLWWPRAILRWYLFNFSQHNNYIKAEYWQQHKIKTSWPKRSGKVIRRHL